MKSIVDFTNKLKDYFATKQALTSKVNTSDIANNRTTTASGKVLDARQGKALNDALTTKVNTSDLSQYIETIGNTPLKPNGYSVGYIFLATNGKFYKVTSTISASTSITVNGNCEKIYFNNFIYSDLAVTTRGNFFKGNQYLTDSRTSSNISVGDLINSNVQFATGSEFLGGLLAQKVGEDEYNFVFSDTKMKRIQFGSGNYLLGSNDIIIEDATIASNVSFSADAVLSYNAPSKTGYTAYVLRPFVVGDWADKHAVVMAWSTSHSFGIWNRSNTAYTWTVKAAVMYVKNY